MATRKTKVTSKTALKTALKTASKTAAELPAGKQPDRPSGPVRRGKTAKTANRPTATQTQKAMPVQPLANNSCPVVGIGASAGGLEAFIQLLKDLPPDTGMAFIFIQHLDPTHPSMLTEILAKQTEMPVSEIKTNLAVKPNRIYIIPPNTNLVILHGVLHLLPRMETPGEHLPVNYFLKSLAEDWGHQAIGVILSGTASDGTLGLKAIKAAGGITFAQDPESAKYDGMPCHAIAAGGVDYILPPREIAKELASLGHHPYWLDVKVQTDDDLLLNDQDNLYRIFSLLRAATGVDFSYYKPTTIKRRIMRRMMAQNIDKLAVYVKYLQYNLGEIKVLSQDILIGVTSFFREPEAFGQLKTEVFPALLNNNFGNLPVKIWVPGCSTGEEAYSIGISLIEFLREQGINHLVQIFATDLNSAAIVKARGGIYPESITRDVTSERLQRFFTKVTDGFQISKTIRDLCIFAEQNIIKDPPFSGLDLISCRNVLIYFGPILQRKVIPIFHYALKPTGYLMLGTSESIGDFSDLFRLLDKKYKIYTKKSALTPLNFDFGIAKGTAAQLEDHRVMDHLKTSFSNQQELLKEADRIVLAKYTPAGVVVNDKLEVIQFRGQTDPYLTHSPGLASLNLFKMLKPDLTAELRNAIDEADKTGRLVRKEGLRINENGHYRGLNVEVSPFKDPAQEKKCFLIIFEEASFAADVPPKDRSDPASSEQETPADAINQLNRLKLELAATIDSQQAIINQRETANEELRAAYEEI